jgi:hypothetical protein
MSPRVVDAKRASHLHGNTANLCADSKRDHSLLVLHKSHSIPEEFTRSLINGHRWTTLAPTYKWIAGLEPKHGPDLNVRDAPFLLHESRKIILLLLATVWRVEFDNRRARILESLSPSKARHPNAGPTNGDPLDSKQSVRSVKNAKLNLPSDTTRVAVLGPLDARNSSSRWHAGDVYSSQLPAFVKLTTRNGQYCKRKRNYDSGIAWAPVVGQRPFSSELEDQGFLLVERLSSIC